ncbi:MAG TPA: sulfotransferase family 2 domain-containing protein [Mycobacteriales bacterium]|nr:sulfotransferase family 2 domain-containing protein [Mycobacteriales bacterium]
MVERARPEDIMIVSHENRFIFVHVPKTAGDAIVRAIAPFVGVKDVLVENDFQGWRRMLITSGDRQLYQLGKHATASEIKAAMTAARWSTYAKVGFVRHPYSRAYSVYSYIARMSRERQHPGIRAVWYWSPIGRRGGDPRLWPAMRAYQQAQAFSDFIRHPLALEDMAMWPQAKYLADESGRLEVDYVGRFEQLNTDVEALLKTLHITGATLAMRNASKGSTDSPEIALSDRVYLAKVYECDFELFGYALNGA